MHCIVRATTEKEALGDNESYENFHPTFTYPVCTSLEVSLHQLVNIAPDIRRR